jgi:hypothetical protein
MALQPNSRNSRAKLLSVQFHAAAAPQRFNLSPLAFDTLHGQGKMDGKVVGSKLVPFKVIYGSLKV